MKILGIVEGNPKPYFPSLLNHIWLREIRNENEKSILFSLVNVFGLFFEWKLE